MHPKPAKKDFRRPAPLQTTTVACIVRAVLRLFRVVVADDQSDMHARGRPKKRSWYRPDSRRSAR